MEKTIFANVHKVNLMTVDHFTNKKVVVIGAALADITGFSSKALLLKDSNPGKVRFSDGGVGRNIAENLVRLGCPVALITAFGGDAYGQTLKKHCLDEGIDISESIVSSKHSTATYLSINNQSGDMEIAIADTDIMDEITPDIIAEKHDYIEKADCIVVDTNLSSETLDFISMNYEHKALFIDLVSTTKAKKASSFLGRFHTIKPNVLEAENLTGVIYKTPEDLKTMLQFFMNQGIKQVFITHGEEGCFYGNKSEWGTFLTRTSKIVNSSGAGDAFMAGLVFSHLNDYHMKETLTFATAMSQAALQSTEAVNPQLNLALVNHIRQDL